MSTHIGGTPFDQITNQEAGNELVEARWSCEGTSVEECCRRQNAKGFGLTMCIAMCFGFCCCSLYLKFAREDDLPPQPPAPIPAGNRDYPAFTPSNGGVDFTTSEYGRFIPIVFGADKLTGNVFWYSGFEEHTYSKGETKYFYKTVSFALGICEGEIGAVLRMWLGDRLIIDNSANVDQTGVMQPNADGFILGATVDLISPDSPLADMGDSAKQTRVTVFTGAETQLPEGIMAEKEGWENSPGYRGLAYVLFENFIVEESTVPNIYVEVLANTSGLYPRLYYDFPVPQERFDRVNGYILDYHPSFDKLVCFASDNSGQGDPPGGQGLVFIDGNTFSELSQFEYEKTHGIPSFGASTSGLYFLSSGHLVRTQPAGNQGIVQVLNSLTGQIDSSIGPGGSIFGHSMTTGFGTPGAGCTFVAPGPDGLLTDYVLICGTANRSFGIARIDRDNQISMVSVNNDYFVLPTRHPKWALPFSPSSGMLSANPTFVDGSDASGTHVFVFAAGQILASGDNHFIEVHKITVNSATATPDKPEASRIATIDVNLISGQGFEHDIACVAVDYSDNCFVIWVDARTDRIIKWSPWTGEVIWSTPVSLPTGKLPYNLRPILAGGKMSFINFSGGVDSINLVTGAKTTAIERLTDQSLPTLPTGWNLQFYNALENSLTYLSTTAGKRVVKVFLDRISRANVSVPSIVVNLLKRVGFTPDQIDVEDLQALSLDGYTIDTRKSLRTIFDELSQVFRFDVIESDGVVLYRTRGTSPKEIIDEKWLGDVNQDGWLKETKDADFARYRKIDLTYRDVEREYGNNVQSVIIPQYISSDLDMNAAIDVTVPIVLSPDNARRLAEILVYSKIIYASQYEGTLPPRFLYLEPTDVVSFKLGDESLTVRMREVTIGADQSVKFIASREDPDIYNDTVNLFGNVGRWLGGSLPSVQPRMDPHFILIPFRTEEEALPGDRYLLYLTLLNYRTTSPPAGDITIMLNAGEETIYVKSPEAFPTWGFVKTPPEMLTSWASTDYTSKLRVNIASDGGVELQSAPSKRALLDTPTMNLATVGGELIQFEHVTDEGNGQYLLTGLHRALNGTEAGMFHNPGERFILLGDSEGILDTKSVIPVTLQFGDSPLKVAQVFVPSNNPFQAAPVTRAYSLNLKPWSVSHIKGVVEDGDIIITWQRRSRYDGEWDDLFEDVPLSDGEESYEIILVNDEDAYNPFDNTGYLRKETVTTNSYIYDAASQAADGFDIENDVLYVFIHFAGSLTGQDPGYPAFSQLHLR